jgi:catechol 2,3-dioxygenase-like lactoylglutathione lyase family enzyme
MVTSRFTHMSILAEDLKESVTFYEEVFGMERIPAPNFTTPVEWLRVGDLTLHLFQRDIKAAEFYHFGLHVDDFEAVYREVDDRGIAITFDPDTEGPVAYELPDGAVQLYLTDPAGNLVEVNYHRVERLDRSIVSNVVTRSEQVAQDGEAADAKLYFEDTIPAPLR